jgi:ribose-phosphate pyrophosphokinase
MPMIQFNGQEVPITNFPNQEACIDKSFFGRTLALGPQNGSGKPTVTLYHENDGDLLRLLLVRKSLWFSCELEIPYFPYSRMDRKSESYIFTLKTITKFINWMEWSVVHIYEPHSDVTPALLNACHIHSLLPGLLAKTKFDRTEDVVIYPDASAHKRYSKVIGAKREVLALKHREFKTGEIHQDIFELSPNLESERKRVWIIDDLCSKGGTFLKPAGWAKKNLKAIQVNLVVAHSEENIFNGEVLKTNSLIDFVYTTDTIPMKKMSPKLKNWHWRDCVDQEEDF